MKILILLKILKIGLLYKYKLYVDTRDTTVILVTYYKSLLKDLTFYHITQRKEPNPHFGKLEPANVNHFDNQIIIKLSCLKQKYMVIFD